MNHEALSNSQLEYLTQRLRHAVSTGEYITVDMLKALLASAPQQAEPPLVKVA